MINYLRHILRFSDSYGKRIILAAVPLFFKTLAAQMMIFYSWLMIVGLMDGTYVPSDSVRIAGTIILTLVLEAAFQNLSDRLQSQAGFVVMAEKRKKLGEHLKRMPMGYFSEGNTGNISTVLATDMTYLEEHGFSVASVLMSDVSNILVSAIFLMIINRQIGITYIVFVTVIMIISRGMSATSRREADVRQEQNERLAAAVIEFISGIGVIKSFPAAGSASGSAVRNAEKAFHDSAEDNLHFERKYSPWTLLLGCISAVGVVCVFAEGWFLYRAGEMDRNYFLGLALFVLQIFGSVRSLYGQSANMALAESSLNRIDALFDEKEMPDCGEEHISDSADDHHAEVEFRAVCFTYHENQSGEDNAAAVGDMKGADSGKGDVLHDISFQVNKGQMLAFVGPSGGGKTTALNLIARFRDVRSGAVLIRGKDVRSVPIAELMDHISMVFQHVYLFRDTVYNNVAMAKPGASGEEVISACRKARCHDFIMQLPDGYETVLGEGGASLSGGERQRISIARCILKDAPIILLDEATASVDVDNERYIEEAIGELCRDKTVIVIAHRLYTVKDADKILVLKDGIIAEQGRYDELVSLGGTFAAMAAAGQ